MKEKFQGVAIGLLIGTLCTGSVVYAKGGTENIQVTYNNIKVYKDNQLYSLKDSNGKAVEPFVYNGTTYLPLRSVANLADMEVTWDSKTNSVYLWDKISSAEKTSADMMEVCPPYEMDTACREYFKSAGNTFVMAGKHYTDGLTMGWTSSYALFNLDGRFSEMNFTVGHVDDSSMDDRTLTFIVDGEVVKEVNVLAKALPKDVTIPLNQGKQLKIVLTGDSLTGMTGLGNIKIK